MTLQAPSERLLSLADGRSLGILDYGAGGGLPLFYFHGYPGSRIEARVFAEPAQRFGLRLIGIDRPGMGLSSFKPGRRIAAWPADVAELADMLGIGRFAVVGCSGGGPYAIACALALPDRVVVCGIVSGAGHAGPLLHLLSRGLPPVVAPALVPIASNPKRAAVLLRCFRRLLPRPDRDALRAPAVRETLAASFIEAFRQGARGPILEGRLLGGDWGLKLEQARHPPLYWWHGGRDRQVPIAMARAAIARIEGCEASFFPGEGHISLIVNRRDEIIRTLVARAEGNPLNP